MFNPYNELTTIYAIAGLIMGLLSLLLALIEIVSFFEAKKNKGLFCFATVMAIAAVFDFGLARSIYIFVFLVTIVIMIKKIELNESKFAQTLRIVLWLLIPAIAILALKMITPIWWDQIMRILSTY